MNWFVWQWHSKSLFPDLLQHLESGDQVAKMSLGEKHSRLYQFSRADQHVDTEDYTEVVKDFDALLLPPLRPINTKKMII